MSVGTDRPHSELTDRQAEILEFIVRTIRIRGFPPTVREIGNEFGIKSPNGVMCHLKALQKKGLIHRDVSSARSIRQLGGKECPLCHGTGRFHEEDGA